VTCSEVLLQHVSHRTNENNDVTQHIWFPNLESPEYKAGELDKKFWFLILSLV